MAESYLGTPMIPIRPRGREAIPGFEESVVGRMLRGAEELTSKASATGPAVDGLPSLTSQPYDIQQRATTPTLTEEAGYAQKFRLRDPDGTLDFGNMYLLSPQAKQNPERFNAALEQYYYKHETALRQGQKPLDVINGISITPESQIGKRGSSLFGESISRPFQLLEQQYQGIRPSIESGIETAATPLAKTGLVGEQFPQNIAQFLTPQSSAEAVTDIMSMAMPAYGMLPAASRFAPRAMQRSAMTLVPALTNSLMTALTQGTINQSEFAAITGLQFAGDLLASRIGLTLNQRQRNKMMREIMTTLRNIGDSVGGLPFELRGSSTIFNPHAVTRHLRELIQSGRSALNDSLEESVGLLTTLMHTRGRVSMLTAPQAAAIENHMRTAMNAIRDHMSGISGVQRLSSPGTRTLTPLTGTLATELGAVHNTITNALQNVTSVADRSSMIGNMIQRSDPGESYAGRFMNYMAPTNRVQQEVAQLYLSGARTVNYGTLMRRTGATRQQLDLALQQVWQRFADGFQQDVSAQLVGLVQRDLAGIVLLDALEVAGQGGRFNIEALQRYFQDHGQALMQELQLIGNQVGGYFTPGRGRYSYHPIEAIRPGQQGRLWQYHPGPPGPFQLMPTPSQGVERMQEAAFRGGQPGVDVTRQRHLWTPGLQTPFGRVLPQIPLGRHTDYVGNLATSTLSPYTAIPLSIINPFAVRELTREE